MCVGNRYATRQEIYYDFHKTRETCVHVGYFIHSGVFMCFYKIVYEYPDIRKFTISGIRFPVPGSRNNRKHTALVRIETLCTETNVFHFQLISLDRAITFTFCFHSKV